MLDNLLFIIFPYAAVLLAVVDGGACYVLWTASRRRQSRRAGTGPAGPA